MNQMSLPLSRRSCHDDTVCKRGKILQTRLSFVLKLRDFFMQQLYLYISVSQMTNCHMTLLAGFPSD